jgi:hypothetical protein
MKARFGGLMMVAVSLGLLACSTVRVKQPFAAKGEPADAAKLNGVWKCGESFIYLNFASNGVASFHVPGWKSGQFYADHGEMTTASGRDQNYFSARAISGESSNEVYDLAAYKLLSDDELVFWWPKYDVFASALSSNKIDGVVQGSNFEKRITLNASQEKILEFLEDPANENKLFDYTSPIIARKVGPPAR